MSNLLMVCRQQELATRVYDFQQTDKQTWEYPDVRLFRYSYSTLLGHPPVKLTKRGELASAVFHCRKVHMFCSHRLDELSSSTTLKERKRSLVFLVFGF